MTRQYFEREKKDRKLIENIEIWKGVGEDPETKAKIVQFLKENLKTNR